MKNPLCRGLVATAVTALGAGLLVTPAAQADTSRTPQTVNAANWLSSQVIDGALYNEQYDFVDWGLTIDTLLALDAVGGYGGKVADIADALADNIDSYTTGADFDAPDDRYAGAIAKSLVAVQAAGGDFDATDFGGTNLVTATEERVDDTTGRLSDVSDFGDNANVFGQSLAVKGLEQAGSGEANAATEFLLAQQCPGGGFRLNFKADDLTCTVAGDAQTDSTTIAVDALQAQADDTDVAEALDAAEAWLVGQQKDDGSFGGGPSTEAPNTNSTALGTVALEQLGRADEAAEAAAWVAQRQVTAYSACGTELDFEFGAVAYDDAATAAAEEDGIEVATADQWRRATAPAVIALQSYDDPAPKPKKTFTVTAPTGYVAAGAKVNLSATGLDAGERYCVYSVDGTIARAGKTDATGKATISATAPSPGVRPVYVYGERDSRQGTGSLRVLTTTKKLVATTNVKTVKRNGKVRVSARGLAANEPVRIGYGGKYIKTANARANGTIDYTFPVGSATGKKNVYVRGIVNTRQGVASFTVVK